MSTKRQQRLARAIENLSGRDLVDFAKFISDSINASRIYGIQAAFLDYSKKVGADEKPKTNIHT